MNFNKVFQSQQFHLLIGGVIGVACIAFILFRITVLKTVKPRATDDMEHTQQAIDQSTDTSDTTDTDQSSQTTVVNTNNTTMVIEGKNSICNPNQILIKKDEHVSIHFNSLDKTQVFTIDAFNVRSPLTEAGQTSTIEFTADKKGTFIYTCYTPGNAQTSQTGKLTIF